MGLLWPHNCIRDLLIIECMYTGITPLTEYFDGKDEKKTIIQAYDRAEKRNLEAI